LVQIRQSHTGMSAFIVASDTKST